MYKKNIFLVTFFCALKCLAFNASANESITPYLIYFGGPVLNSQAIPELAKYDLIVTARHRYSQVNGNTWSAIKAIAPNTRIFLYQGGPYVSTKSDSTPVSGLNNLGRYNVSRGSAHGSLNQDHPDWFLKGTGGQRVQLVTGTDYLLLDYGNRNFADYWAKHTLEDIVFQKWVADGVYIDLVGLCNGWKLELAANFVPVKYSTCDSWNENMSNFIAWVSAPLHDSSQKVMVNIGQSHSDQGPATWQSLAQKSSTPDILHEEGAFAAAWGSKGDVQLWPVKSWRQQVDMPSLTNKQVAFLSHTNLAPGQQGVSHLGEAVNHDQLLRFAAGSYMLARNASGPTTYFQFVSNVDANKYNKLIPVEIYDEFDIGKPVAKYEKKLPDQDLYFRKYTKGAVYVNPGSEKIVAIKADSDVAFSNEYHNARQDGADWYFDLKSHDAVILKSTTTTNSNKQTTTAPVPPVLK